MTPKRKQRLLWVVSIVCGAALVIGLVLFALGQNINLFFTPTQVAQGEAPAGQSFRIGGMVVDGSVTRPKGLEVVFGLTDHANTVMVHYEGILPDLFREGQGIVALGQVDESGKFTASQVLAKHDENSMPPEVAEALKQAGQWPEGKP